MLKDLFLIHKNSITKNVLTHTDGIKEHIGNRFTIITGSKGVGKTIALQEYARSFTHYKINSQKVLYLPVDHFKTIGMDLYDITEDFVNCGGQLLCLDDIHKSPEWCKVLKDIHDFFPGLQIIVTCNSAFDIHELDNRATIYKMKPFSFREFIKHKHNIKLPTIELKHILKSHKKHALKIVEDIDNAGLKILPLFNEYLKWGHYPALLGTSHKEAYLMSIEKNIRTTIESDLLAIYPKLTGASVVKIKRLLSVIANAASPSPDMLHLKKVIEVGDDRTLKIYLKYLHDVGLITCLYVKGKNIESLDKPKEIYLNNTNQVFALNTKRTTNTDSLRDLFFARALLETHEVNVLPKGNYIVDQKYLFKVTGKDSESLKDEKYYLASDGIQHGLCKTIPLWLFGFLY